MRSIHKESDRIGYDIYDGIARVLRYVITKAEAARQCRRSGKLDMAKRNLEEILFAVREAYADMQDVLHESRRNGRGEWGLAESLAVTVEEFRQQSGGAVELNIAPTWEEHAVPRTVRRRLLQVAQESLANVRRHAGAHRVNVGLAIEENRAQIRVEDDGRGFLLSRFVSRLFSPIYWPQGLRAMRDRARRLGGTFEIASSPGRGEVTFQCRTGRRNLRRGNDPARGAGRRRSDS